MYVRRGNVKVFQKKVKGHMSKFTVLSGRPCHEEHMPNMNALSLKNKKLWPMLKFLKSRSTVIVKVTCSKLMVQLKRPRHKEQTCQI